MKEMVGGLLVLVAFLSIAAAMLAPKEVGAKARSSVIGFALVCAVMAGLAASYQSVPAGYRGVLLRFGAVNRVLDEGFHLITPFVNTVTLMDVRTQKATAQAAAASQDLQTVSSEVAINYHVIPAEVGMVYKTVGVSYEERVIQPAVQETIKSVISKYTARQLIQQREQVKSQVDALLSKRLLAYNIQVEPNGVSLTNFDFSKEFNQSIESTQVAQQEAAKAKFILSKTTTEAQTAIMKAKGEAESNRLKAIALESRGGEKVLAREWIEKWDGRLPAVTGSGNSNLIDLRSLMEPEAPKKQ